LHVNYQFHDSELLKSLDGEASRAEEPIQEEENIGQSIDELVEPGLEPPEEIE
jgi:hypothetical protein